jgi:hypothetical protein
MTTKTLVLPLAVCAVVHAGATRVVGQSDQPQPPERAVVAPKPDPEPTALALKPGADELQGTPDSKPAPAEGQILKRFMVPMIDVPEGKHHFPMANSVAINDDGTRVIVDNRPAVDVWDTASGTCVRAKTTQDSERMGCDVIIAQDASRFYVRNDKTKKVDAHDARGALTGSAPQIGFAPPHGLKRPGYDFAPRDYIMGSKLPGDVGIFTFDPKSGAQRIVVRIKDIWDVERCQGLVRRPGGDFLTYYHSGRPDQHLGLYVVSTSGKFTKVPGIPSKGMKAVDKVSLSPDSRYLMFQGLDRLEVWDVQARQLVVDWRQPYRTPLNGRFTGEGRLAVLSVKTNLKEIATSGLTGGYENHTARLDVLEIPSLRVAGQLNLSEFDALIPAFAFSPNGKRLVVADWDQVVLVDVESTFPAK